MPCAYADFTVDWLMPMTWPSMSISGPPELPGLIGADVCSRPLKVDIAAFSVGIGSERSKAETTPTRHGLLELERFADCDGPLALLELV